MTRLFDDAHAPAHRPPAHHRRTGIGPTHDDKTYAAIAAAFGRTLERHAPTVAIMQQHYGARGVELNEARLRMAELPTPADEVLVTPGLWVPLAVVDRVYVLPGIPRLFQSMISAHQVAGHARGSRHEGCTAHARPMSSRMHTLLALVCQRAEAAPHASGVQAHPCASDILRAHPCA